MMHKPRVCPAAWVRTVPADGGSHPVGPPSAASYRRAWHIMPAPDDGESEGSWGGEKIGAVCAAFRDFGEMVRFRRPRR